jgi:hypothetical protein
MPVDSGAADTRASHPIPAQDRDRIRGLDPVPAPGRIPIPDRTQAPGRVPIQGQVQVPGLIRARDRAPGRILRDRRPHRHRRPTGTTRSGTPLRSVPVSR